MGIVHGRWDEKVKYIWRDVSDLGQAGFPIKLLSQTGMILRSME